jgi:hypothetical protein
MCLKQSKDQANGITVSTKIATKVSMIYLLRWLIACQFLGATTK